MLQFLLTLTDESNYGKIEDLYNKYHNYMMKCAVAKFKHFNRRNFVYDAEDAVQNTFLKITRHIEGIDFSRGEKDVKNYCLAILNNEIYNILEDNHEVFEVYEDFNAVDEYSFIAEIKIREQYDAVVAAIEKLDTKYSTTLQLFFCDEMTPNEIAELMGISPKTVYTRIYRGKNLLLEILKGGDING